MRTIESKPEVSCPLFVCSFLFQAERMAIGHRRPKLKLEAFENGTVVRLSFAFRKWVCAFLPEGYLKVDKD